MSVVEPVAVAPGVTASPGATSVQVPWKKLVSSVELTVVGAVSTFLGSVSAFPGGAWDSKHLEAAAVGAALGAAYNISGAINSWLKSD